MNVGIIVIIFSRRSGIIDNISFTINTNDKVVFLSRNEVAKTTLFKILAGEMEADSGTYTWGITTTRAYLPKDNSAYFNDVDLSLVEWLRQFAGKEQTDTFLNGFLGRMLFSGEEVNKKAKVLSGGEKMRCMFAKMMLTNANCIILDEPTNHLDLESITAFNDAMVDWKHIALFSSHDHAFTQTVANRIIENTWYSRCADDTINNGTSIGTCTLNRVSNRTANGIV